MESVVDDSSMVLALGMGGSPVRRDSMVRKRRASVSASGSSMVGVGVVHNDSMAQTTRASCDTRVGLGGPVVLLSWWVETRVR